MSRTSAIPAAILERFSSIWRSSVLTSIRDDSAIRRIYPCWGLYPSEAGMTVQFRKILDSQDFNATRFRQGLIWRAPPSFPAFQQPPSGVFFLLLLWLNTRSHQNDFVEQVKPERRSERDSECSYQPANNV